MKKRLGFVLFFLLFCSILLVNVGIVSAGFGGCAGGEDQEIFRLFDTSNSHGAIYTDAIYNYRVCFDELFVQPYLGTGNVHSCTGNDLVLKLAAPTNGHGELPSENNYNTDVCFQDLICTSRSVSSGCLADEAAVVYLSDNTNAHLSTTPGPGYDVVICCSSASGINPTASCGDGICTPGQETCGSCEADCGVCPLQDFVETYWTDITDGRIDKTNRSNFVNLVVESTFSAEAEIIFEVFEDDVINDDIFTISLGNELRTTADAAGMATVRMQIDDSVVLAAGDFGGLEGDELEFFFRATEVSSGNQDDVNSLIVEDKIFNDPPTANITGPVHRQIYFVNEPLNFVGSCVDAQSPPDYAWKVDDDNPLDSFTDSRQTFQHIFTTTGQKTISLRCVDTLDASFSNEIQIAILVIGDDSDILDFVEKPKHKEIIFPLDAFSGGLDVEYSGLDSYTLEVVGPISCSGMTLNCLSGNCPSETKNSAASIGCDSVVGIGNGLGDFANMNYKWEFDDGLVDEGLGRTGDTRKYGAAGDKFIDLTINYEANGFDLDRIFRREFKLLGKNNCTAGGESWCEFNHVDDSVLCLPTHNTSACTGPDFKTGPIGSVEAANDCCPVGQVCSTEIGNPGCQIPNEGPVVCGNLSESECSNAPSSVYESEYEVFGCNELVDGEDIDRTPECKYAVMCGGCVWNSGECKVDVDYDKALDSCPNGVGGEEPLLKCAFDYESDADCATEGVDRVTYTITGTVISGAGTCDDDIKTLNCPRRALLPGFGLFNLIITSSAITLIYGLLSLRKERE